MQRVIHPDIRPYVASFRRFSDQRRIQIPPIRVRFLDHADLPWALPCLDGLFPQDGGCHGFMQFEPDQIMDVVSAGKSVNEIVAMFEDPFREVRSDARVQRSALTTGEDVDTRLALAHQGMPDWQGGLREISRRKICGISDRDDRSGGLRILAEDQDGFQPALE
ncbi:hypothetical protein [Dokdonella immobilis]|uniref:hypothetical protein n=1 Tax=Dokdonella immobilis TaxID=578942 RepID=UPI003CCC0C91